MTATRGSRIPDRHLAFDRHLAREAARALARALAGDLARALDLDLDRTLAHALDLDRTLARARALASDLARTLDSDLASDLDRAHAFALAHALAGDLDRAFDSADAHDLDLARTLDRHLALDLVDYLERGLNTPISADRAEEWGAEVQVARAAGRLAAAAARVLPARDRARYAEEFQSELWEIVRVGGGRRLQLAYAARQVIAAPRLRAGLRVPRRRGAVP